MSQSQIGLGVRAAPQSTVLQINRLITGAVFPLKLETFL